MNDSAWRTTIPMIGPPDGHPRVHERADARLREKDLIAGTADRHVRVLRQAALVRAPSEFGRARCLPRRSLRSDQVFTNSSTAFGRDETCVSRSEMWMTFGAGRLAEPGERSFAPGFSAAAMSFSNAALLTPVAAGSPLSIIVVAISSSARFVKWLDEPGLAPWSMIAVVGAVRRAS